MKNKLLTCICICLFTAVSTSAFATITASTASIANGVATSGQAVTSGQPTRVTIGVTTPLTYDPSPSVSMSVIATTTAYAIMTTNSLTDKTNGMEYGTTSAATGYAQRTKTVDAATAVPDPKNETALPTGSWTWMGGNGS